MMTFRSENIDSVGFRRMELLQFLASDGIVFQAEPAIPRPTPQPAPSWAHARRGLRRLSLPEAANVLIGCDPLDTEWRGDDEWREFEGAKRVLLEAVEAKELPIADIDFDNNAVEIFNTADVRAWAQAAGYSWPIPAMPTISISNSEAVTQPGDGALLQRLQDSERERNKLHGEVEKLKSEVARFSNQAALLAESASQIGKLQAEIASGQNEIRELKAEIGQGKSLSTWQKLVIGMAVTSYEYQPDASRSAIPADISAAVGSVGIEVTAETVRKCLKSAAEAHLPTRR